MYVIKSPTWNRCLNGSAGACVALVKSSFTTESDRWHVDQLSEPRSGSSYLAANTLTHRTERRRSTIDRRPMTFRRQQINSYESRSSGLAQSSSPVLSDTHVDRTTLRRIIWWFLSRVPWIRNILAGTVYLNCRAWISTVRSFHSCPILAINANLYGVFEIFQSRDVLF